jgi:hypothetical protein
MDPAPSYRHIGVVADAITAAGIDTARWLGHEIDDRLNRDNKNRGWNSPNVIHKPIAYLRARLAALDWSGPSPSELATAERAKSQAAADQRQAENLRKPVGAVPDDAPARRAAREAAKSRGVHKRTRSATAAPIFASVPRVPHPRTAISGFVTAASNASDEHMEGHVIIAGHGIYSIA